MQMSLSRYDAGLSRHRRGYGDTKTTVDRSLPADMKNNAGTMAPKKLQCFSVACHDMPHLEFGDKIVLPAKVLLELQCLKVPTPMLFHIRQFAQKAGCETSQYCSVQEFSAPDGQVFIPYWMMQNLQINEGQDVVITHVRDIPRGIYCRLQPEDALFLDVAAEIGPKLLMESALRRYSVLGVNQTVIIDHGNSRHYVKVIELKPGTVVSLLGDVDLELDFAVPPQTDIRRQRPQGGAQTVDEESTSNTQIDTVLLSRPAEGQRQQLGNIIHPKPSVSRASVSRRNMKLGTNSFHNAKRKIQSTRLQGDLTLDEISRKADTEALGKDIRLAQAAFTSTGYRLGGISPSALATALPGGTAQVGIVQEPGGPGSQSHLPSVNTQRPSGVSLKSEPIGAICSLCLAEVATSNLELHALRCARNPSYHKFKCPVCLENVFRRDEANHLHCNECDGLTTSKSELENHILETHSRDHSCVECGMKFTKVALDMHHRASCTETLELCTMCGFKVKRRDMESHKRACSSRTDRCDICSKYIKIVDLEQHTIACISDREAQHTHNITRSVPSNQHDEDPGVSLDVALQCAYCQQCKFIDPRQLERHMKQECRIARSFQAPLSLLKAMPVSEPQGDVRSIIQGKLKRRADVHRITDSASALPIDPSLLHNSKANNQRDVTEPLVRIPASKPQSISMIKTIKPKLQPTTTRQPYPRRPVHLEAISSAPIQLVIANSGTTAPPIPTKRRTTAPRRPHGAV